MDQPDATVAVFKGVVKEVGERRCAPVASEAMQVKLGLYHPAAAAEVVSTRRGRPSRRCTPSSPMSMRSSKDKAAPRSIRAEPLPRPVPACVAAVPGAPVGARRGSCPEAVLQCRSRRKSAAGSCSSPSSGGSTPRQSGKSPVSSTASCEGLIVRRGARPSSMRPVSASGATPSMASRKRVLVSLGSMLRRRGSVAGSGSAERGEGRAMAGAARSAHDHRLQAAPYRPPPSGIR